MMQYLRVRVLHHVLWMNDGIKMEIYFLLSFCAFCMTALVDGEELVHVNQVYQGISPIIKCQLHYY